MSDLEASSSSDPVLRLLVEVRQAQCTLQLRELWKLDRVLHTVYDALMPVKNATPAQKTRKQAGLEVCVSTVHSCTKEISGMLRFDGLTRRPKGCLE